MKIIYWSDYACPYCYIGITRLQKAIKELGKENEIELEMRAFQLDPNAPDKSNGNTLDRFSKKYKISKEQANKRIEHIDKMGREEGLDFNYLTTLFTNTMNAHRLTKYAYNNETIEICNNLIEKIFELYFSKNEELANIKTLVKAGVEVGIKKENIETLLGSDDYKDEVSKDILIATNSNINAVPFFIIGKYALSGVVSKDNYKEVILKALDEI